MAPSLAPAHPPFGPEELQTLCREVSAPLTFALARLSEARQRFEQFAMERSANERDAFTALGAARSGIEHATRLIAEFYACLRTRNVPERLELAELVETILELLDPELRRRVVVRRTRHEAVLVRRRGLHARALMTSLLDALGRTHRDAERDELFELTT